MSEFDTDPLGNPVQIPAAPMPEPAAGNPFDEFDADEPWMGRGPAVSLWQRFKANAREGFAGSITGATIDATVPGARALRQRDMRAYEAMPQWETPLEATVALGGQVVGGLPSIENFIPLGWGERLAAALGLRAGTVGARVLAGSVDAGVTNALADPVVQGIQIAGGTRAGFDPGETAAAAAIGAVTGGLLGGAFGARAAKPAEAPAAKAPGAAPSEAPAGAPEAPRGEPGAKPPAESTGGEAPPPAPEAAPTPETPPAGAGRDPVGEGVADRLPEPKPVVLPEPTPERPDPVRAAAEDAVGLDASLGERLEAEAAVREGRPIEPPRPPPAPKKRTVTRRALTLLEFIARQGGIREADYMRGEYAARDLDKLFIPGFGRVVRKTGLDLDHMRELAAEAGYPIGRFGTPEESIAGSTPSDLLDAIDADMRAMAAKDRAGRVYSADDADAVRSYGDDAVAAANARAFDDFRGDAQGQGFDVSDETLWRAAFRHYAEAGDIDTALERAIYETEAEAPIGREIAEREPMPFFDDEGSDGRADASPASGREIPRGGAGEPGSGGSGDAGDLRPPARDAGGPEGTRAGPADAVRAADAVEPRPRERDVDDDPFAPRDLFRRQHQASGERRRAEAGVASRAEDAPAFVRLKDAADALIEAVDPAAVRQGRLPPVKGIQGVYKTRSGIVRVTNTQDFEVLTHELGHHLEVRLGAAGERFLETYGTLLERFAYVGADPAVLDKEGFAEFVRLAVTNRAYVERLGGPLVQRFDDLLAEELPDVAATLAATREAYSAWLAQPSRQAVASTIVTAKKPAWYREATRKLGKDLGGTIADVLARGYAWFTDDLHPLQRATRGILAGMVADRGGTIELPVSRDPYKLARMSRGAFTAGHMDILYGVHAYGDVRPSSPALRDALIEALGAPNVFGKWDDDLVTAFGAYLWSRRVRGEWDRFDTGRIPNPPDKLSRGDHDVNIRELEAAHPAFAAAAEKVYAWNRALWAKKRDAGLISGDEHAEGLAIADYVPGKRHFDEAEAGGGLTRGGSDGKGRIVNRFRGSDRDVVNPIESLIADAYQTSSAIARNEAVRALARLADAAGPGANAGRFAERIPASEIKAHGFDVDEVITTLGRELDLGAADVSMLKDMAADMIADGRLTLFTKAQTTERGENIAWFREAGKLTPLRLADGRLGADMVRAFNMMSRDESHFLVELLAKPAAVLRAGITTHPTFLVANFVRDQMIASVLYGQPFRRLRLTLGGMGDEILGRDAVRAYNAAGGVSGGAQTAALRTSRVERDLQALRRKGFRAERLTSIKGILEATELSETGMRLGLFKTFFEEAGKRGLDANEATYEAAWRARDHLDWDRRGFGLAAVARMIPFLNASLQGMDKMGREMLVPAARKLAGQTLTAEDERTLARSLGAWARLGVLTVAGVGLHALMSRHDDYAEIDPRTRATHWMIRSGDKWVAVPKPFELAVVLNAAEAGYDAWRLQDPTAAERYLTGLFDVLAPPSVFEGNPVIKSVYELKTNTDFFTDRAIVPEDMRALEPWLQYTARTSSFARMIGKATNQSPLQIDHMVTSFGGSWGRSLLSLYDKAAGEKPDQAWYEALFTRRFIKDASRGSSSVGAFWDEVGRQTGKLSGATTSYRAMMAGGEATMAASWLGRQDDYTRAYVTAGMLKADVMRLHPLGRAERALKAITALRREVSFDRIENAAGGVVLDTIRRRQAEEILSDLAMAEARNALIVSEKPGWAKIRAPIDTGTYVRELDAVSPALGRALADRYATAKVLKADVVAAGWPDLRRRLLAEGTAADLKRTVKAAHDAGFELGGTRIKRKPKPGVPAVEEED